MVTTTEVLGYGGQVYTRDKRSRNWRHKSTPFSGIGFWHRFFVPYTSGMKISGAENKHG